jgi:thymidylate synthase
MQECYDDKGVDQVREIIDLIKNDPFSRRIILTAWNPAALSRMALPPCHMMAQFYVSRDGLLECQMYQRSCDVFLGVPFNIMSYSLLTHMIAHVCGIRASKLTMCFGDTHIYKNHLEQVLTQMKNVPKDFPTVSLSSNVTNIFDFTLDDIHIENYESHPYIRAPMAV